MFLEITSLKKAEWYKWPAEYPGMGIRDPGLVPLLTSFCGLV